ncbi:hypothetical protein V6N13_087726 [Hibiscus sabdariffa]|uniref:Translation initiation factor IF2/IF5 domain-containing protein n=1 Tax=Hibiscus sabdariffa TaxID=183260 RepID=A0ABR2FX53_9ROSI
MSTGPGRRVSRQDIQLVQNLIERCLQLYMTQREVVDTLLVQAKIEPGFTELVWQKLEEENREFFQAYYLRLMVKQQIMEFNKLLEQQVRLMGQIHSTGVSSISNSNGPQMPLMPQNSSCYAVENTGSALKQEGMHHPMGSSLPNVFTNGSSSLHAGIHAPIDLPTHASRIDAPPGMLSTQNSNMGLMQGINGKMIKPEAGYSASSSYMFGAESNVLEARPTIGDTSFSTVESSTQPMNEPLLDADISSFGFLGQIPRNFSLSDLTADFSQSSDILESYPRSPFLATDNETFLDSREREHQGENRSIDGTTGLSPAEATALPWNLVVSFALGWFYQTGSSILLSSSKTPAYYFPFVSVYLPIQHFSWSLILGIMADDEVKDEIPEITSFDPTKKKKKKKVVIQDAADDPVDKIAEKTESLSVSEGLDFSTLKKKKKKQVETSTFEEEGGDAVDDLDGPIDGDEEGDGIPSRPRYPWEESDRDYIYEELLGRVFNILKENNPELAGDRRRTVMRPPQVLREGTKKTVFVNFMDLCKTMHRQPDHVMAFLLAELGTSGSLDGQQRLVVKGRFAPKNFEGILRRYINEYVICLGCKSPDTILSKENRLFFLRCEKCGSGRSVAPIKAGFVARVGRRNAGT